MDQALTTLPAGAEGHLLNLADSDAVQDLFARLGGIDHLVFTAGESLPAQMQGDTLIDQL